MELIIIHVKGTHLLFTNFTLLFTNFTSLLFYNFSFLYMYIIFTLLFIHFTFYYAPLRRREGFHMLVGQFQIV